MKVRCSLCGKVFPSELEYLDGNHDQRVHQHADPTYYAIPMSEKTKPVVLDNLVKDVDELR